MPFVYLVRAAETWHFLSRPPLSFSLFFFFFFSPPILCIFFIFHNLKTRECVTVQEEKKEGGKHNIQTGPSHVISILSLFAVCEIFGASLFGGGRRTRRYLGWNGQSKLFFIWREEVSRGVGEKDLSHSCLPATGRGDEIKASLYLYI